MTLVAAAAHPQQQSVLEVVTSRRPAARHRQHLKLLWVPVAGEVAPLECNLDALAGISYSKGCYIGQERNSYTHYRGVIRRRMMPVRLEGLDGSTASTFGRVLCTLCCAALP